MACERVALIRTMIILASICVIFGISVSLSPFFMKHSESYVSRHEIDRVMKLAGAYPLSISEERFRKHLDTFDGCPREIDSADTTVLATVAMFDELGYPQRFEIPRRNLISFILHIKEGHKDVPYHNWMHAFSAGHFAFLLTRELNLKDYLNDVRAMAYLIAALCHDLGHPGTTSTFQQLTNSAIASRFEAPHLLEKYHLNLTRQVLEINENNILENVPPEEKDEFYATLQEVIFATDLANHFTLAEEMAKLGDKKIDFADPRQMALVLQMLATAVDLNDQTKKFDNNLNVANLICQEFYAQGIRERQMGVEPDVWMDPERANVIEDQREFIKEVAKPLFELLHKIFPNSRGLAHCVSNIKTNLARWAAFKIALQASNLPWEGVPIEVLKNEELLTQAEEIYLSTTTTPKPRRIK